MLRNELFQDLFPVVSARFCCNDENTCNEKFIKKKFNKVSYYNSKRNFHIILGKPTCNAKLISTEKDYNLNSVSDT